MSGYDKNSRFSGTIVGLARCHHREPVAHPPFPPAMWLPSGRALPRFARGGAFHFGTKEFGLPFTGGSGTRVDVLIPKPI